MERINQISRMKFSILILLTFFLVSCMTSNPLDAEQEKIRDYYVHKNYQEVILLSIEYLKENPDDAFVNHCIGRALSDSKRGKEALAYLEKAIKLDNEKSYISSWSYLYLGSYYSETDRSLALQMFDKVIELNKTSNSASWAKMEKLQLAQNKADFTFIGTEHINFYFNDVQSISNPAVYTEVRETAFVKICSTLKVEPDFSIDFYVWHDRDKFYEEYGKTLGFSMSSEGIIHSADDQSVGHEIAHSIIYHLYKDRGEVTGLINEGGAVYFDQNTGFTFEERVKQVSKKARKNLDIKDMWANWGSYTENVGYPVGGAFIEYLVKKAGVDKLILLLSDQSYENAVEIYGSNLDLYITDFENWVESI